jgi:hypothetical protein
VKLRLQLAAFGSLAALLLAAPIVLAQGDAPAPPAPPAPAPTDTTAPAPPPPVAPAAADADGGAPAPTPAPTTTAEPTPPAPLPPPPAPAAETGPTVTLTAGTGPAVKDEVKKKDKDTDEEKKEAKTPIAGSTFFFQTGASPNVFSPGMQLSPAVTVSSYAAFKPAWTFSKSWRMRSWVSFFYEWTDTADTSTTRKNQPMFGDTPLYLDFTGLPTLAGIKTTLTASVGFPTSPESQSRTLYFSPGAGVSFAKAFEHVLGGEVSLGLIASYSHPIYQYTTGGLQASPSYAPQCYSAGGATCNEQATGAANTENAVSFIASIGAQWGKWSPSTFLLVANGWGYQFKDLAGVQPGNDPQHFRQRTFFGVSLDYDVVSWLSAEAGYQMLRNTILDGDGKLGNPFYGQYQDGMQVYLATNIKLDELWLKLSGKSSASAVTAKTKPVFSNF